MKNMSGTLFSGTRAGASSCWGRQRGATLISLMVGLTISMMVVAGMMLLYRNAVQASSVARQGAQADDRLTGSLLAADQFLQEAGFGIESPGWGTHLLLASGAKVADEGKVTGTLVGSMSTPGGTPRYGNLIAWVQNLGAGAGSQCAGLLAPSGGGVIKLGPVACTDVATQWNTLDWRTSANPDLAWPEDFYLVQDVMYRASDKDGNKEVMRLEFFVEDASPTGCAPFGVLAAAGAMRAVVEARNSSGLDDQKMTSPTCLINFPVPTASP